MIARMIASASIRHRSSRWLPVISRGCQPPEGSQANPPGVSTQLTGPPVFPTVVAPVCSGPHGMPTAGRVSRPALGGVDDVGVGTLVVSALVVGGLVVSGGGGELVAAAVVAGDGGVLAG